MGKKIESLGYSSEHVLGIKVHSCIAISPEELSYGLMYQSYDTRPKAKNTLTKAKKTACPIEEKESYRWLETIRNAIAVIPNDVHFITICDREGDFYELYAQTRQLDEDFHNPCYT